MTNYCRPADTVRHIIEVGIPTKYSEMEALEAEIYQYIMFIFSIKYNQIPVRKYKTHIPKIRIFYTPGRYQFNIIASS